MMMNPYLYAFIALSWIAAICASAAVAVFFLQAHQFGLGIGFAVLFFGLFVGIVGTACKMVS